MKIVKVLKTNLVAISSKDLLAELKNIIDTDKKRIKIAKVNSEFLLRALKFPEFAKTLDDFDINVADGVGVLWAAKYLSLPITDVPILRQAQAVLQMVYTGASLVFYPSFCRSPIPEAFRGTDMAKTMLSLAGEEKIPVYLFGSNKETLVKAVRNIKKEIQEIDIRGFCEGYNYKNDEVVKDISESGAKFLFVALGSPKQEYWIRDNAHLLSGVRVAVGEGGTFEFLAGNFKRAPGWMKTTGLEWLFRLFANRSKTQTGNRARRVWNAVPVFIWKVVKYKLEAK